MNLQEINQCQTAIYDKLEQGRIYEAILTLKKLVDAASDYEISEKYNLAKTSYDYMLQYLLAGADDSHRDVILIDITNELYTITDKCVISLSANQSYELFYTRSATLANKNLQTLILLYREQNNKYELLKSVEPNQQNVKAISALVKETEKISTDIFNKVWCSFPLSVEDKSIVNDILLNDKSEVLPSLVVSALFLSLTKFYDEAKVLLLLETYVSAKQHHVQTRALVDFIIISLLYSKRILNSKRIKKCLDLAVENPHFNDDLSSIINRLVRSRNTENITRKMREELMPDIMNMSPELIKKMKDKSGPFDPSELEENPEWQDWLDKSGVSKKIEELNKLQVEGDDVFISTFAHLKSYPFFNTLSNWFLPFYITHSSITDNFNESEQKLISVIKDAPFLCDSDKYSFIFSLSAVPVGQRSMMMSQFDAQKNAMNELSASELPDDEKRNRDRAINRYIQDLYRFFKLFSRRNDFKSIFETSIDVLEMPYVATIWDNKENISVIAEFYLKNGFFNDAVKYYRYMLGHFEENGPHILQKLGFAYQNLGNFKAAIKYYKRYELVDESNAWNHRHIAVCYRAIKDIPHALEYYQKALDIRPNNASICLNIGHCLLEMEKAEEALKFYFKADYLEPESPKCWRPIAWCAFLTGNNEQSENYYQKLINSGKATSQDYLNYGHLLLCTNRLQEAVAQYAKSATNNAENFKQFNNSFDHDVTVLIKKGVERTTAQLVKECVIKQINN